MKKLFLISFAILIAGSMSYSQHIGNENPEGQIISLGINSDAFAGMELGYAQSPGTHQEKDLQIYARFSFPLLLTRKGNSFDSWELNLGANAELVTVGQFGTIADIRFFLIHHHQILGTFMPLGFNLRLTPAYHFQNGYLGFQINWNQTIATHISHAQHVKHTFADLNIADKNSMDIHPRDGWYGSIGSHVGFGIESGWVTGSRFFLYGDLGIINFSSPYTGLFDAMMMGQVPFYGNLRLFYKM